MLWYFLSTTEGPLFALASHFTHHRGFIFLPKPLCSITIIFVHMANSLLFICHFSVKESHICLLNHAWLFSCHRICSCLGEEPSLTVTKPFIGEETCTELLLMSLVLTHCYNHFNLVTSFVQTMKIQTMNSLNE